MLPNTSRLTGDSSCQPTMAGAMPDAANTAPAAMPVASTIWWGLGRDMAGSVRRASGRPRDPSPGAMDASGSVEVAEDLADLAAELVDQLAAPVDGPAQPEEAVDHAGLPAEVDE